VPRAQERFTFWRGGITRQFRRRLFDEEKNRRGENMQIDVRGHDQKQALIKIRETMQDM